MGRFFPCSPESSSFSTAKALTFYGGASWDILDQKRVATFVKSGRLCLCVGTVLCSSSLAASSPFVIAAAIGQQPGSPPVSPSSPAAPPPQPAKPNAEGAKLLAEAISRLDPKKLAWVQTTFWEQADLQGLMFQAEGSYLSRLTADCIWICTFAWPMRRVNWRS